MENNISENNQGKIAVQRILYENAIKSSDAQDIRKNNIDSKVNNLLTLSIVLLGIIIEFINISKLFGLENWQNNVKLIKNRVAGMGLKARVPAYLQKEALKQSAPYAKSNKEITDISNKTMSLNALFSGLPFSRKWIN